MARLKVTKAAKKAASKALKKRKSLPKSKKFGTKVGVKRAKQLKKSKSISTNDACDVGTFRRFTVRKTKKGTKRRKKTTAKEKGAIGLWGGADFIDKAYKHCKRSRTKKKKTKRRKR